MILYIHKQQHTHIQTHTETLTLLWKWTRVKDKVFYSRFCCYSNFCIMSVVCVWVCLYMCGWLAEAKGDTTIQNSLCFALSPSGCFAQLWHNCLGMMALLAFVVGRSVCETEVVNFAIKVFPRRLFIVIIVIFVACYFLFFSVFALLLSNDCLSFLLHNFFFLLARWCCATCCTVF